MSLQRFEEPQLLVRQAVELSLSGPALLELMRAVLSRGASFRFCARGWSMAPFIRDGDVITVSPFGPDLPPVGGVVAFVRPGDGLLVVHRVVARRGDAFLIQGDGVADDSDGLIPREYLLGQVTRVERGGRLVSLGLGGEQAAIAWLSRVRLLIPLRRWASACRACLRRS